MIKINYKNTGFALIKPPSRVISYHIIKNISEHDKLVEQAINSGYCLYHAPITKADGKYLATQPWSLDERTIPQITEEQPIDQEEPTQPKPVKTQKETKEEPTDELRCPHCGKKCNSKSGLTLHIKTCQKV